MKTAKTGFCHRLTGLQGVLGVTVNDLKNIFPEQGRSVTLCLESFVWLEKHDVVWD